MSALPSVGFIGLGNVGGKLAGSLLRNGVRPHGERPRSQRRPAIPGRGCDVGRFAAAIDPDGRRRDHLPAVARNGSRDIGFTMDLGASQVIVTIYFEDFVVGSVIELGTVEVTEQEIIEFATRYDPQPFHVDLVVARDSPFQGLIASGWHTCSLYMRQLVDGLIQDASSQGSPGMEELRWLAPVRPGDRLTATYAIEDVIQSFSNPRRGTVMFRGEMTNQDGVIVLRMRGRNLYGRRPT